MTVTRAVPSRRQSAGATALWTPSTPARARATAWGSPELTTDSNGESGPVPMPEAVSCSSPARAGPDWASESARGLPS